MNDICTFILKVRGQVCESEINAAGPLKIIVTSLEPASTLLAFSCDQSGLVGMINYLHGLGFEILSVNRAKP